MCDPRHSLLLQNFQHSNTCAPHVIMTQSMKGYVLQCEMRQEDSYWPKLCTSTDPQVVLPDPCTPRPEASGLGRGKSGITPLIRLI